MLANFIENLKISLHKHYIRQKNDSSSSKFLMDKSHVVSAIPNENAKYSDTYKEGKFIIIEREDKENPLPYLVFEWIPIEGYYTRFSKRNFTMSSDSDKSVCLSEELKYPVNFWQIFKINSYNLSYIKIIWTDWDKDLGYLIIKDCDFLKKNFKFINGGLRNVSEILNKMRYKKKVVTIDLYQMIYEIKERDRGKNVDFSDADIFGQNYIHVDTPIDVPYYESFFNEHGQLEDIFNFKRITFYYGLSDSIRKEAWKFLLGFYTYSSTPEERFSFCQILNQNYETINDERLKVVDGSEMSETLKKFETAINKDINRTDRENPFYAGNNNENLKTLQQILINYAYTRPNMGYTQGMSDLLSVLLQVFRDECDTFWCFIELIEKIYCSTFPDTENMDHLMETFIELMRFLLPNTFSLINNHDLDVCLIFIHRWYLLCFQREFYPEDVKLIWEACWSTVYCPLGYFQFFIGISIIECYHKKTPTKTSIFSQTTDEVLVYFTQNERFDCDIVLAYAQYLLRKFRKFTSIPCKLRCFVKYKIGGGWDDPFKPIINCSCKNKFKRCRYENSSISHHMNTLKSKSSGRIDIDKIRSEQSEYPSMNEEVPVFEK